VIDMARHDQTSSAAARPTGRAAPTSSRRVTAPATPPRRGWFGAAGGAVVGFLVGAAIYLLLNPLLERSGGWVEETQGMLWNVVPVLTILGAIVGHQVMGRRSRS
jgi:H+/Cl- antiporter ClcA